MSDKLPTHPAAGSGSLAGSPPAFSGRRLMLAALLTAAIASSAPASAQALTLDNTSTGPPPANPPTDTNPQPPAPTDTLPAPTDNAPAPTDTLPTGTNPRTQTTPKATPTAPTTTGRTGGGLPKHHAGGAHHQTTQGRHRSNAPPAVDTEPAANKGGPSGLLVALVALAALLTGAIPGRAITRRILRKRRRVAWQLQARREPPKRPCSERSHYCQKTSIKVKPGRRDIAYLDLHARNGDADELETRASTRLVDELNSALSDYRRGQKPDELRTILLPTAEHLVEEVESWLRDDAGPREITTDAHLTAAEVEYEFTLYRCSKKQDGPDWEKEDEWQASLEDEEDEDVAHLHRPRPASDGLDELSAQLADFVTRVDVRPSLEVSSKTSPSR